MLMAQERGARRDGVTLVYAITHWLFIGSMVGNEASICSNEMTTIPRQLVAPPSYATFEVVLL